MKKSMTRLLSIFGLFLAFQVLMLTSCEGPEGPAGPQGPVGADGSAICGDCHNLTTDLYAKIIQYEASTHRLGGNYERSTTSCAKCHTHEGFMEYLETGAIAENINNPTPVNCRTCHPIHESYTQADYALRTVAPFELDILATKQTFDMGNGNICANCHQPRVASPMPEVGGADVTITSYRWGYHYSSQAAMMVGEGGLRIPGSIDYNTLSAKHYNNLQNGCVDCHMANAYGSQAGGHTFNVSYDYHGTITPNMAACTDCHSGATSFDIMGGQTEIAMLLDSLKSLMTDAGIYGYNGSYIYPGTYSAEDAGCYLNYQFVYADHSLGVHNTSYARALLTNSIEHLNAKK
jgi:hypothetical protein